MARATEYQKEIYSALKGNAELALGTEISDITSEQVAQVLDFAFHQVMGMSRKGDLKKIKIRGMKKSFRKQVKKFHPDIAGYDEVEESEEDEIEEGLEDVLENLDPEDAFKLLSEAYEFFASIWREYSDLSEEEKEQLSEEAKKEYKQNSKRKKEVFKLLKKAKFLEGSSIGARPEESAGGPSLADQLERSSAIYDREKDKTRGEVPEVKTKPEPKPKEPDIIEAEPLTEDDKAYDIYQRWKTNKPVTHEEKDWFFEYMVLTGWTPSVAEEAVKASEKSKEPKIKIKDGVYHLKYKDDKYYPVVDFDPKENSATIKVGDERKKGHVKGKLIKLLSEHFKGEEETLDDMFEVVKKEEEVRVEDIFEDIPGAVAEPFTPTAPAQPEGLPFKLVADSYFKREKDGHLRIAYLYDYCSSEDANGNVLGHKKGKGEGPSGSYFVTLEEIDAQKTAGTITEDQAIELKELYMRAALTELYKKIQNPKLINSNLVQEYNKKLRAYEAMVRGEAPWPGQERREYRGRVEVPIRLTDDDGLIIKRWAFYEKGTVWYHDRRESFPVDLSPESNFIERYKAAGGKVPTKKKKGKKQKTPTKKKKARKQKT